MKLRPVLIGLTAFVAIFSLYLTLILVAGNLPESSTTFGGERIAVVDIRGPIVESRHLIRRLDKLGTDASIKAIVVRIDSPGGGVGPSQEIHDEIVRLKKEKPVVASFGSVAASGGYYVAAGCSRIVANAGSLTGSIGVIIEFADLRGLFDKIGIQSHIVKSGPYKDIGSPSRAISEADRILLQGVINDTHRQFVDAVATGRQMDTKAVLALADGRIFTGRQAKEAGLVDRLGGLKTALEEAKRLAKIEGEATVLYPKEESLDLVDLLLENVWHKAQNHVPLSGSGGLSYRWTDPVSRRSE